LAVLETEKAEEDLNLDMPENFLLHGAQ
jgi:hypothetical protein